MADADIDPEPARPGLLSRLQKGPVICAEGYLFECERRGYLQAGAFVPEVVLEHPEVVRGLHRELVHAGSDVVEALTYYAHHEKLRLIGKSDLLEPLNRQALAIAAEVADESGALLAGNLSNSNLWEEDGSTRRTVRAMFDEQLTWAVDAGVDFVIAETLGHVGEALVALDAITDAGLPAVVTLAIHRNGFTREGLRPEDACARLEDAGAAVVGLNCLRGPRTMLPLLERIRERVSGPVAALPVPYRTWSQQPTMHALCDPERSAMPFPTGLDPFFCTRDEMGEFATRAHEAGIEYLGVCCGCGPHHIRSMAEALGRSPAASRYSTDMSKHAFLGSDPTLKHTNLAMASGL